MERLPERRPHGNGGGGRDRTTGPERRDTCLAVRAAEADTRRDESQGRRHTRLRDAGVAVTCRVGDIGVIERVGPQQDAAAARTERRLAVAGNNTVEAREGTRPVVECHLQRERSAERAVCENGDASAQERGHNLAQRGLCWPFEVSVKHLHSFRCTDAMNGQHGPAGRRRPSRREVSPCGSPDRHTIMASGSTACAVPVRESGCSAPRRDRVLGDRRA